MAVFVYSALNSRHGVVKMPGAESSLDDAATKSLEAAAVALEMNAGHFGDQAIGDLGRNLSQEQAVLAVLPSAGDQIEIFIEQTSNHARNADRVILQITVHGHDHITACRINPRLHRGGLLEILGQLNDPYVRAVFLGRLHGAISRRIAAAIIDQRQFSGVCVTDQRFMHALD